MRVSEGVLSRDEGRSGCKKTQRHHPASYWIKMTQEFSKRSLPVAVFCQEKGLAVSTFQKWRQKLLFEGSMGTHDQEKRPFLPVHVTPPEEPLASEAASMLERNLSAGLSLQLSDTLKVTIDKDFHEPTLHRLIQFFSQTRATLC